MAINKPLKWDCSRSSPASTSPQIAARNTRPLKWICLSDRSTFFTAVATEQIGTSRAKLNITLQRRAFCAAPQTTVRSLYSDVMLASGHGTSVLGGQRGACFTSEITEETYEEVMSGSRIEISKP